MDDNEIGNSHKAIYEMTGEKISSKYILPALDKVFAEGNKNVHLLDIIYAYRMQKDNFETMPEGEGGNDKWEKDVSELSDKQRNVLMLWLMTRIMIL